MNKCARLYVACLIAAGTISLAGCKEGGPGPYGTTSEQNVGSRGSSDFDAPKTVVPPIKGAPTENAADKAIDSTHGVGGFGGTSQENAGSSTPGGITAVPGPSGAGGTSSPATQPAANNSFHQNGSEAIPINTGPGTTNGNTGYPIGGSNTNTNGEPTTTGQPNSQNRGAVNGGTNNPAAGGSSGGK